MSLLEWVHAYLWVRLHWAQAYLAHHRDDQAEYAYHETRMRRYEAQLELHNFRKGLI